MVDYCWVWDTKPTPTAPPYFPIEAVYACADTFYRARLDDFIATYNGSAASLLKAVVDGQFSLRYGGAAELYLEQWRIQYGIIETSIPGLEPAVALYTAPAIWMERLHYIACNDAGALTRCPCRITG